MYVFFRFNLNFLPQFLAAFQNFYQPSINVAAAAAAEAAAA